MELLPIVLPGQRVVVAIVIVETIGTLAVVGLEGEIISACSDNKTIVSAKSEMNLTLFGGGKSNNLSGTIIVAGGLQKGDTLREIGRYLTEMTAITHDARQLARQGVERRVENETATVVPTDTLISCTSGKQEYDQTNESMFHLPRSFRSAWSIRSK